MRLGGQIPGAKLDSSHAALAREMPDGRRNLWWRAADATGQADRLTTTETTTQSPWDWSPDGEQLIIQEGTPQALMWSIRSVSMGDGSRSAPLTGGDTVRSNPALSADGN